MTENELHNRRMAAAMGAIMAYIADWYGDDPTAITYALTRLEDRSELTIKGDFISSGIITMAHALGLNPTITARNIRDEHGENQAIVVVKMCYYIRREED